MISISRNKTSDSMRYNGGSFRHNIETIKIVKERNWWIRRSLMNDSLGLRVILLLKNEPI